jgi:CheY-like chemotaxis protein
MPVKILLADKSITIQKVVEMLFSGKEYEVQCVSDGETALSEAARINPDVVLADIDLPRVDGYTFSARLRKAPALTKTPVILMMSRDDVYDEAKGRQAMITDHIAKPFESQELIGKVKKAVAGAPQRPAESVAPATAALKPQPATEAPKPQPAAAPPAAAKTGKEAPVDIFDIIEEAPSHAEMKQAKPAAEDEGIYEVEPEIEFEEELDEGAMMLPTGAKAVEEMREGLGLVDKKQPAEDEIVSFESIDMGGSVREYKPMRSEPAAREWKPPVEPASSASAPSLSESDLWNMAETVVAKAAKEMFTTAQPLPAPSLPEQELRSIAEKTIAAMAKDVVAKMPPPQPPQISADLLRDLVAESVQKVVRDVARDIVEKVAWEVIPDLAEMLIKAEIERLKSEP